MGFGRRSKEGDGEREKGERDNSRSGKSNGTVSDSAVVEAQEIYSLGGGREREEGFGVRQLQRSPSAHSTATPEQSSARARTRNNSPPSSVGANNTFSGLIQLL